MNTVACAIWPKSLTSRCPAPTHSRSGNCPKSAATTNNTSQAPTRPAASTTASAARANHRRNRSKEVIDASEPRKDTSPTASRDDSKPSSARGQVPARKSWWRDGSRGVDASRSIARYHVGDEYSSGTRAATGRRAHQARPLSRLPHGRPARLRRRPSVCAPNAGRAASVADRARVQRSAVVVSISSRSEYRQRVGHRRQPLSRPAGILCRDPGPDAHAFCHRPYPGGPLRKIRRPGGGTRRDQRCFVGGDGADHRHRSQDGAGAQGHPLADRHVRTGLHRHCALAAAAAVGACRARADIGCDRVADDSAMITSVLAELAWQFSLLSFLAIGGVNALIPAIHRRVVEMEHWMTDADFAQAFAIAQAAPGPNMLIVSVIGWKVSGVLGALVATAAICVPSSVLTFGIAHIWDRFREAPLRVAIQHGLVPVTVGLVLASGYILARTADQTWAALGITVATVALTLATLLHPPLLLSVGAAP